MRQSLLGFIGAVLVAGLAVAAPNPNILVSRDEKDFTPPTESYKNGPDRGRINHIVTVAQTSHEFRPNFINATIGDTITFRFYPQEHSVVLADFQSPCVPWRRQHPSQPDVWSGMIKEADTRENPQNWTIRVSTSDPTFYYCSGPASCKGWGMVFATNPSATQSWADFHARAKTANYQISPGETPPPEGGEPVDDGDDGDKKSGLSTGALAGIIVGAIIALALIGLLFFWVGKSRRQPAAEKPAAPAPQQAVAAPVAAFDHPPPGYDQRYSTQTPGWETAKPPVSPHLSVHPQLSPYGSPNPGHTSWAPSELGGETSARPVAEIYTPGVDELIPLNSTPRN